MDKQDGQTEEIQFEENNEKRDEKGRGMRTKEMRLDDIVENKVNENNGRTKPSMGNVQEQEKETPDRILEEDISMIGGDRVETWKQREEHLSTRSMENNDMKGDKNTLSMDVRTNGDNVYRLHHPGIDAQITH